MSFDKNCDIDESSVNTGTDSNKSMGPTRMIVLGSTKKRYTPAQFAAAMLALLTTDTAAVGSDRIYPIFGQDVPVRGITSTKGENKTETLPDGSMGFLQNGMYTDVFMTKEGGDCLAKIFFNMNGSQLGFWKIDGDNKVKVRKFSNGDYGFLPSNMIDSPLPDEATFDAGFKNYLRINHDPKYSLKQSEIFQSTEDLSGLKGLIDVVITAGPASTTTKIRFYVRDLCCNTNIGVDYDTELPLAVNFLIKDAGATVTPSGVTLVANSGNPYVEATVTAITSGHTVTVAMAAASQLLISGMAIEGTNTLSITIP